MNTFATKKQRPVPAVRKTHHHIHHPMGPALQTQQAEIRRILRSTGVQAKLTIGQPNDNYEQEADRVADQVMAMSDPKLQRQLESEEEEDTLQTKLKPGKTPAVSPNLVSRINSLKDAGQPLDPVTQSFFETRFGRNFSQVRVYTDARAAESANTMNANAYTAGRNIVFGAGKYAPATRTGKSLLAHELTHTIQPGDAIRRQVIPSRQDLDSLTPVTTKRLYKDGSFTSQLLNEISGAFTKAAAFHNAATAQQIIDALEASDTFVKVAAALDTYYARDDTPDITVTHGFAGTKFVPAGVSFAYMKEDKTKYLSEDKDLIFIDYKDPFIWGSDPQQTVLFASGIIHEATHAYNTRITKVVRSGLRGLLQEEKRTRETEIKSLEEIKANTADHALLVELDKQIKDIRKKGLTERKVAESVKSGGSFTYLEHFFLKQAIDRFRGRRHKAWEAAKKAGHQGFQGVVSLRDFDEINLLIYRYNVVQMVLSNQPPIRSSKVPKIMEFLGANPNLMQLTDASDSGLNDGEKLMLNHVLLLEAYAIEKAIREEWKAHESTSKDPNAVRKRIATKYLGRPNVYATLPAK